MGFGKRGVTAALGRRPGMYKGQSQGRGFGILKAAGGWGWGAAVQCRQGSERGEETHIH